MCIRDSIDIEYLKMKVKKCGEKVKDKNVWWNVVKEAKSQKVCSAEQLISSKVCNIFLEVWRNLLSLTKVIHETCGKRDVKDFWVLRRRRLYVFYRRIVEEIVNVQEGTWKKCWKNLTGENTVPETINWTRDLND